MDQSDAGEIREPVETGAIPDSVGEFADRIQVTTGEEPTVEFGGQTYRPGIDRRVAWQPGNPETDARCDDGAGMRIAPGAVFF